MPGKKFKILVTGFEPFDDDFNMSGEIVKRLQHDYPNVEIVTRILPGEYRKAEDVVTQAIKQEKPDFVIALGEENYAQRAGITIETAATSEAFMHDRTGEAPDCMWPVNDDKILRSMHPTVNTVLRDSFIAHSKIASSVRGSGYSGGFLCEDIFYTALKQQAAEGRTGHAMFLHVQDLGLGAVTGKEDPAMTTQEEKQILDANPQFRATLDAKREEALKNYTAALEDTITYIGRHQRHYMDGSTYASEPYQTHSLTEETAAAQRREHDAESFTYPEYLRILKLPTLIAKDVQEAEAPSAMGNVRPPKQR